MSDVFRPESSGMLRPDLRESYLWEGRFVEWPQAATEVALPRRDLQEASFSGLGGLLFELDHTALAVETSTATYYMEARRVAEGFPAFVGKTAVQEYRFLVIDGVGFAAERTDKHTGEILNMQEQLMYDRFVVRKKASIFYPEGVAPIARTVPTGTIRALQQVPVRAKPLLRGSNTKRKSSRDFLDR